MGKLTNHPRPLSFYGPDNWDGYSTWQELEQDVQASQRAWDAEYLELTWWERFKVRLAGLLTEPVWTSGGLPMPCAQSTPQPTDQPVKAG